MDNRGKIAVVTGGNKGIGYQIVRQLAAAGLTVYLGARDVERGSTAAEKLVADGLDVRVLRLDVTDPSSVGVAAEQVAGDFGRLDVLVNNAGVVVEWGIPVSEITAEQLRTAFDTNVFGVVTVTNAFLPLLRRSAAARIVNMSSPLGSLTLLSDPDNPISTRGLLAYSSSKAALNAVTVLYANALRASGAKVNSANPGLAATDLNADSPFSRGVLTAEQAAAVPVRLALLDADGPTGAFLGADGPAETVIPW
ncbi:SDR family oxidoreductase [Nocardia arthritidis]|nr:SDR family oxidoreductase [Nocardia arthritidis]